MTYLFLFARILYGGYFLWTGVSHFTKRATYTQYAASKNVPLAAVAVLGTGVLLVLGGLSVLLGAFPEIGLWLIVVFLVGTTPMMHRFWSAGDANQRAADMAHFMKNVALLGAALMMVVFTNYLAALGPWPFRMVR